MPFPFSRVIAAIRNRNVSPTERLGAGGARAFGGFLVDNEKKAALQGTERYRTFSELIANVAIVAAGVRHVLNTTAKAGWKFEPADDSGARGEEIAEVMQDIINSTKTPWHRVVRRSAMFRFYGFSIQEWTAQLRPDGNIGLFDVESRPQITIEQWDLNTFGDLLGVVQRPPMGDRPDIYLPRAKIIHMVDDSIHDAPDGLGLLRHISEPARRLARFEQLEGFGFETDLRGIPVGRAPLAEIQGSSKLTAAEKAAIQAPMRNMIKNHIKSPALGLFLDSSTYKGSGDNRTPTQTPKWDFKLLQGGATSQAEIANTIERMNREIARIMGIDFLLLGEQGTGSLAMSRDKSKNFALMIDGILKELRETYDRDLVTQMMLLNGWPMELRPKIKTDAIQHREIEEITGALESMARSGAMLDPEDPAINEVRELLGLSKATVIDLSLRPDPLKEKEDDDLDLES